MEAETEACFHGGTGRVGMAAGASSVGSGVMLVEAEDVDLVGRDVEEEGHCACLCADFEADLHTQPEKRKVFVWVEEDAEGGGEWEGIV